MVKCGFTLVVFVTGKEPQEPWKHRGVQWETADRKVKADFLEEVPNEPEAESQRK